jgi:hypothetical protein
MTYRPLFALFCSFAFVVVGCAVESAPEETAAEENEQPNDEETEALSSEFQSSRQCRYVGEQYTMRGSRNCTYPCTPNGDACFGSENSLCKVYDCGRYGRVVSECRFVSCRLGQRRAW